jgi:hypothetical protein
MPISVLWILRVMKVLRLDIEEESPGLKPGEIQVFAWPIGMWWTKE